LGIENHLERKREGHAGGLYMNCNQNLEQYANFTTEDLLHVLAAPRRREQVAQVRRMRGSQVLLSRVSASRLEGA